MDDAVQAVNSNGVAPEKVNKIPKAAVHYTKLSHLNGQKC
jgi:hypothetical protein